MSIAAISPARAPQTAGKTPPRPAEIARELGPLFARRAAEAADEDRFVADNFATLKASGLVEAGVPAGLGGGGADVDELAAMLRTLAYHCGSTALALSMHTHQVAVPAWRWTHQKAAAVEPLLKRIAGERILLLSSGGSDWIAGSGTATKVDGGYRIDARKVFTSGAPTGDLFMTGAVRETPDGPMVLHFGVPMNSPHVKVLDTWRTLGMRATGSHDVLIEGHVVPEAAVAVQRKAGEWHPLFHIIATTPSRSCMPCTSAWPRARAISPCSWPSGRRRRGIRSSWPDAWIRSLRAPGSGSSGCWQRSASTRRRPPPSTR